MLRTHGYRTPISPILSCSGSVDLVLAPMGCFGINLAAILWGLVAGIGAHLLLGRPASRSDAP